MDRLENSKNLFLSLLVTFIFLSLAYGSSNDSSSSSSTSSSPYSNVNAALKECGDKLKRDTAAGYYYHLSDVQMYKRMEKDQENCMAGYGHYPK